MQITEGKFYKSMIYPGGYFYVVSVSGDVVKFAVTETAGAEELTGATFALSRDIFTGMITNLTKQRKWRATR